jgi:hypothetical protein
MLNCGIHPCPLKCHQISDHSQMPCQHPYSGTCPVNHALKWKCHQSKPDPCPVCVKEAERAEEKRNRALKPKQKQLDAIVGAQERANVLKQKIKDIDPARTNARKVTARFSSPSKTTNPVPLTPPSNLQSNVPSSKFTSSSSTSPKPQPKIKPSTAQISSNSKQSKFQQPRPSLTSLKNETPKSACQDWLHQKQVNGEKNSVIDGIMELSGLEDVKPASKQPIHQREAARIRQMEGKVAREKALAALKKKQEKEERKYEEAHVQQSLQRMGVCSVGYRWIKQPQGYRCAGGTHFISNDQLMRQQEAGLKKKQDEEEGQREEAQVQLMLQQMGMCSAGYHWIKQSQGYRCTGGGHFISNDHLMRQKEAARIREQEAEAAQERALAALKKQEEERRHEEAQVQQKLQQMGVCSAGYAWIKQSQGYQCAGGTHFISNDQLGI